MAQTKASAPSSRVLAGWAAGLVLAGGLAEPALAQNFPITPAQRSTAQQVAQAGVPLSELAPNAPDTYTVKRGDTLWAISGMFLRSPWRWPELWGMNLNDIRNPHLIFPGQQLYLEKSGGLARLRVGRPGDGEPPTDTVRVTPRTRYESLADAAIPTLAPHLIEPFLSEPLVVAEGELEAAPRLVATPETRVLITRGDRVYARGRSGSPLVEKDPRRFDEYRVFRNAVALKDPVTSQVLGYEARYLGKAQLVRSESVQPVPSSKGSVEQMVVPATLDIVAAREEMRVGDRLLPEPPRQLTNYVPRAPQRPVEAAIVSVYGDAVNVAGQNQVVAISRGRADGLEVGHVLAILTEGQRIVDRTQPGERSEIKIPDERNGLLMVFRTFDRISYGLILEIGNTVKVGDRVVNPR
jgi:hypothetical protein